MEENSRNRCLLDNVFHGAQYAFNTVPEGIRVIFCVQSPYSLMRPEGIKAGRPGVAVSEWKTLGQFPLATSLQGATVGPHT